ncbi:MAG: DUF4065 domain-containing protein [Prevotella sp.]|nr:DUF4065 domain-containing protein [Prevotella sp.]
MRIIPAKPKLGDEYKLKQENSTMLYRGKDYSYIHFYYENEDTCEMIVTTELDELNISQVYNQYRAEHGIPFPDEIIKFRQYYDLSQTTMSRILGFGDNQFRLYESGEVPNLSNGKLLKSVMLSPDVFGRLVEDMGNDIKNDVREQILGRISALKENNQDKWRANLVFGNTKRDKYNGYARKSLDIVENCILYFVNRMGGVYKTQMNKLLFYTDFLSYKRHGMGMTGLSYLAIQFGPVPKNWDKVYSAFDSFDLQLVEILEGIDGERIISDKTFDNNVFTEEQLDVLNTVYSKFGRMTSKQISQYSHSEPAWQDNIDNHSTIDYTNAFYLQIV